MEMIIGGSVTPRATPQGRLVACASVTTTRAPKSGMSVGTALQNVCGDSSAVSTEDDPVSLRAFHLPYQASSVGPALHRVYPLLSQVALVDEEDSKERRRDVDQRGKQEQETRALTYLHRNTFFAVSPKVLWPF